MKLFLAPFACSLASHIALREAGIDFEPIKVDIRGKKTATGGDYFAVNPKGYVPALQLDNGEVLTENVAVLQYIADRKPEKNLAPAAGTPERYRLLEWLAFINSEVHKNFSPLFNPAAVEGHKQFAKDLLAKRFDYLQSALGSKQYLMGNQFTVADAYLFTTLNWTGHVGMDLSKWPALKAYAERVAARPSAGAALGAEGAMAK
jgi:glutathione S-transferase